MRSPSRLSERFRHQARTAIQRRSPLYVALLEAAADDLDAGGPTWELLAERAGDSWGSVVPLRLMAAVHRLVLSGAAPELAAFYPSAGGSAPVDGAWPVFRRLLAERAAVLRPLVARPLQTNEVGRCAALLAGFAAVARDTGLPLRVLELGASAGLNLNWDRYRYERPGAAFGPAGSPVRLPLAAPLAAGAGRGGPAWLRSGAARPGRPR